MRLRGLHSHIQCYGDFLAAFAFGKELHDFALPGTELDSTDCGTFEPDVPLRNPSDSICETGVVKYVLLRRSDSTAASSSRLASDFRMYPRAPAFRTWVIT